MVRESASTQHALTNIHRFDGKPVHQQCKVIKSIDPRSLQVLSDLAFGGQTAPVWPYPEMTREREKRLTLNLHPRLKEPDIFALHGVTQYQTCCIVHSAIPRPRGSRTCRRIQALASNSSLHKLRSRKLCVDCRAVEMGVDLPFEVFVSPMGSSEPGRMRVLCLLGNNRYKREREKAVCVYKREKQRKGSLGIHKYFRRGKASGKYG